jgi:hypothetical protein
MEEWKNRIDCRNARVNDFWKKAVKSLCRAFARWLKISSIGGWQPKFEFFI